MTAPGLRAARPSVLLFLAALAVKAAVLYALREHPVLQPTGVMDSAVYLSYARSGPPPVAYFISPLYLYFLRWTGASVSIALIVQIVLGSLGAVLAYDTARRGEAVQSHRAVQSACVASYWSRR